MTRAGALGVLLALTAPTSASAGQTVLTWQDNAFNETSVQVARKVGPCAGPGTWYIRATLGADVTTYTDTGLPAGAVYCYKVRARNAAGVSAYSNEAEGVAKASPSCGLVKTVAADGTVTYTWRCHP